MQLPSKRTFRNLDRTFVEARAKELDAYLQALIAIPGVHQSQILASFLTESSDPALFMPDTVGDKAGKMIKSVPSMLRKDVSLSNSDQIMRLVFLLYIYIHVRVWQIVMVLTLLLSNQMLCNDK